MKENEKGRSQGQETGFLVEKLKAEIAISIRMESAFHKDEDAIFVECRLHSYRNADSIPLGMRATGKA